MENHYPCWRRDCLRRQIVAKRPAVFFKLERKNLDYEMQKRTTVVVRWYIVLVITVAFCATAFMRNIAEAKERFRPNSDALDSNSALQASGAKIRKAKFPIRMGNKEIELRINEDLSFQIFSSYGTKSKKVGLEPESGYLSQITLTHSEMPERFRLVSGSLTTKVEHNEYGISKAVSFTALSRDSVVFERCTFILPFSFSNVFICEFSLKNESDKPIEVGSYTLLNSLLDAKNFGSDSSYKFWSFQGGSYPERYDWIFPLTEDYQRANYQGMNAPDYGGGIPVVDLWTKKMGIAFSVINKKPQFVSLPVKVTGSGAVSFSIADSNQITMEPHQSSELIRVAVIVHHGDFFNGLRTYSELMQKEGFNFPRARSDAYQPEWCAWGYERDFNKEQILKSLPTVKKLGFGWVTIDDGWQNNLGDWEPNLNKFPGGESDFKAFIDSIHSYGLKVRLWWCPFTAQDSSYSATHYPSRMNEYGMNIQSKLSLEHPDWFILDRNGDRVQVSWWNAYLLCPALQEVRAYFMDFTKKAITKWKIDGFKIDGQNLNMVPECFNQSHNHENPIASSDSVPVFFKDIYNEATKLDTGFVIQLCPCGTNFSFYNLPFVNQTVASDPLDSWQVRLKGKTFRALYGSNTEAYSGDHVELTNHTWDDKAQKFVAHGMPDFVSTLAVGGVPASKFTISGIVQEDSTVALNHSDLKYYQRWLDIYNKEEMSKGIYLNLYDIAFDKPETHVIKKGSTYYYSFFSDSTFKGKVELRGLTKGHYKAFDLYTGRPLSAVNSDSPFLKIKFDHYMIVKVERGK
jgi:alpha-galactosidase